MIKERLINTASSTTKQASALWQQPPRLAVVPNWVKSGPFIALHLACLAILFVGVNWTALILMAATYLIRMFGITGVYHRYYAHRSYKTSRVMQFLLACLGCAALQKGPLWWASHHRRHHRYSDTPDDPHSPLGTSFWWAHVGWILGRDSADTHWEDIRDWSRYPELRWLDRNHWIPGIVMAVGCFLIGGWTGLVWGFVVSTVLTYHATFSINSLSHLFGRRRYATSDDSRNNWLLALITLGEGWHNNHHHYQSSANQGFMWWEIDISYMVLRTLAFFGLIWDIRRPGAKVLQYRLVRHRPQQVASTSPSLLEEATRTETPADEQLVD
jgi:stearoyl-CoA desaturase (Delta-9 desaturase)